MSETLKAEYPHRLDITDMPRDTERCLGGLRAALCATFNYCKQYPTKLEVFITVLEYVLERAKDLVNGVADEAAKAQEEAKLTEAQRVADELAELRKAEIEATVASIKAVGKAVIVEAQEILVLEDLKQYVIVAGFEPEGATLEEICTSFVKAKTAQVLAQVADYKASVQDKE